MRVRAVIVSPVVDIARSSMADIEDMGVILKIAGKRNRVQEAKDIHRKEMRRKADLFGAENVYELHDPRYVVLPRVGALRPQHLRLGRQAGRQQPFTWYVRIALSIIAAISAAT